MHQLLFLGGDTNRAKTCVASVATAHIVTDATGHLQNQLAGENTVGTETHHFECIRCQVSGFAETASRPEWNLALTTLGRSGLVAVAQLGYDRVTGVVKRNLVSSAGAAIDAIEEEATDDIVRVAHQVIENTDRS